MPAIDTEKKILMTALEMANLIKEFEPVDAAAALQVCKTIIDNRFAWSQIKANERRN